MSKMILLADDDENDVILIQRALAEAGINSPVRAVPNGAEAIRFLSGEGPYADRGHFGLPDLLLLDLRMGGGGGSEVLRWLQQQPCIKARLPVVMLTAVEEPKEMARAYRLGANSYLVKPFEFSELVVLLREVVDYWFTVNRVPDADRDSVLGVAV